MAARLYLPLLGVRSPRFGYISSLFFLSPPSPVLFSSSYSLPPFTPLQLCTSRRVDDVNHVTPVNAVTPITLVTLSPHHHPLHHPSWRWWPTSRRGRTEVDWVSKKVPVFSCCFLPQSVHYIVFLCGSFSWIQSPLISAEPHIEVLIGVTNEIVPRHFPI